MEQRSSGCGRAACPPRAGTWMRGGGGQTPSRCGGQPPPRELQGPGPHACAPARILATGSGGGGASGTGTGVAQVSLRRGGLHHLPGPNAEALTWNRSRQVCSAMGPAHLSAAVPDGRLPALAPHLAAMRRRGSEGTWGLGSIPVCANRARGVPTGAPSAWARGSGRRGTWGSGRWRWHVTAGHELATPRLLSSSGGFGVRGLRGTPERGSKSSRASSARDFASLPSFPFWSRDG